MNTLMPPMPAWTSLRREMDRLLDRTLDDEVNAPLHGDWLPFVDLSETDEAIMLRMEIPGIDPKDIQVRIQNQLLTVRGEKHRESERKDERFYRSERQFGSFVRAVRLPSNVREDRVNAVFRNGLLTVTLEKVAEAAGTAVPVKAQ